MPYIFFKYITNSRFNGIICTMMLFANIFVLHAQNLDSLSRSKASKETYKPLRLESADEVEQRLERGII